jgi:protein phosphatase
MAELPTINLALYAQTDVGMVRSGNEDNFLILDLSSGKSWTASEEEPKELLTYTQGYYGSLLAVSDGMGGALAGEVASRMAVETVRDRMLQLQAHEIYGKMPFYERLRLSIEEANLLINGESQTNPAHKGLGATFTGVAVHGNQIYFAQVGDSRAYLLREGKIVRITKDQSLVQQLIDAGQITEEEAETHSYRNVILQALGAHNNVNVEVNCLTLSQLDTLVLCSDGLSGKIHQDDIARIVNEASDFKSACQTLIDLANERGGEDNITVVIAQLSGAGLSQPAGDPIDPQTLARSPDTPTEINWGLGAKTDPLNPSASSSDDGHAKATEPLPTPPMQSMPFTSKLPRNSPDTARTNDLSDRRGPITSVFAPEDFEEEPEVSTVQKPAPVTTPLEQRQTQPLAATTNQPAAATTPGKASPSPVNHNPVQNAKTVQTKKPSEKNGSRMNSLILGGLLALGVAGLVIGVTSYLKRQEQVRTAHEQALLKLQIENQNQKEGQIGRLRDKIAEISKRLQTTDKPALKERRELWHQSLNKLSLRLDDVAKISSDQLQQINQACDEIGKELKKIEDEVNNLQGLLPSPHTNREPVKV